MTDQHVIHAIVDVADIGDISQPLILPVIDATITLDEGWAPYVQASITCPLPSEMQLELIDPRKIIRVLLVAGTDQRWSPPRRWVPPVPELFPDFYGGPGMKGPPFYLDSPPNNVRPPAPPLPDGMRGFTLLIGERSIDHEAATMTLTLVSDESRLIDLTLVNGTPDTEPVNYQTSLRALTNYVLGKIGASLAPGGDDASYEIYPEARNLITNPSINGILTGYTGVQLAASPDLSWTAAGFHSVRLYNPATQDSYLKLDPEEEFPYGIELGKPYTFSGTVRLTAPLLGNLNNRTARLVLIAHPADGLPYVYETSAAVPNEAGEHRVYVVFTLPPGLTSIELRAYHGATGGQVWWDAFLLREGVNSIDYFDGSFESTPEYSYEWDGEDVNDAVSIRTPLIPRDPAYLTWEPGVTAWDFLAPLIQASGLRLYCDEDGLWRLEKPTIDLVRGGVIELATGVNLTRAGDTITRSGDWFDSVLIKYTWLDSDAVPQVAYDAAGAPGTKTMLLEHDRPYPGPGGAHAVLRRAVGRGRTLDLDAVSDYAVTPGMSVIATLPETVAQSGYVSAVRWSFPADEMTVETRGLADTLPTAWIFAPLGLTWADIPAGVSWENYTA